MVPEILVARAVEPDATLVFEYRLDFWTHYWMVQDQALRKRRRWIWLSFAIAIVYAFFFFLFSERPLDEDRDATTMLVAVVPTVLVSVAIGFGFTWLWSLLNTILARLLTRTWRGRWRITLAEDGIHADVPSGTIHVKWESVRGIARTKRNVFFVTYVTTLMIPAKAFGSLARQHAAVSFAEARRGWAPADGAARAPVPRVPRPLETPAAAYAPPTSMRTDAPLPVSALRMPERDATVVARALVRHTRASLTRTMVPALLRNRRTLLLLLGPSLVVAVLVRTLPMALFSLAAAFATIAVSVGLGQNRYLKLLRGAPAVYDFTDDGMRTWIPGQAGECRWDVIPKCIEQRERFDIYLPQGTCLTLAKKFLERPADEAALRALLAARLGARARLRHSD